MQTYTVEQAATALSLDRDTLRKWLRAGRIGGFKAGTDWRLTKEDLDAFVDRNRNSYRPGPPVDDDDDDAYLAAEAVAVLKRIERGEERVITLEQWEARHGLGG
jgi:excisionase family DNA binding protein